MHYSNNDGIPSLTLTLYALAPRLKFKPRIKLVGCGRGNNPASQKTIGYYQDWLRSKYGNSFICFLVILLCKYYTGHYPEDFPRDCKIWWTVNDGRWTIYIKNLQSLVRYLKVKATTTHSAVAMWLKNTQKYGLVHTKESAAYDLTASATNAMFKDPDAVSAFYFHGILPSISREEINNHKTW